MAVLWQFENALRRMRVTSESLLSPLEPAIALLVGILWAYGTVLRQFVAVFRLNSPQLRPVEYSPRPLYFRVIPG